MLPRHELTLADKLTVRLHDAARYAGRWARGPARQWASQLPTTLGDRIRRNLASRRLLSFPHLLVAVWMIALLWGERWAFSNRVRSCRWENWENWVSGIVPGPRSPPRSASWQRRA
jgi:ethanolamine phosphate phosphodiesterase